MGWLDNTYGTSFATPTPVPDPGAQIGAALNNPADVAAMDALGAVTGPNADATAILQQTLNQYGLGSMSQWAWNEITNGASADQVLVNLYSTPQFAQRFPGIIERQNAGLPPISPSDYITYEDQAKQLENQYGLPQGFLSDPNRVGNLIGKDVSMTELTDRVQNGYAAVAYSPPAVRQAYTAMFGANGDGALAAQFLDTNTATQLLTKQATAAQIAGQFAQGGVNMDQGTAMELAQQGQTQSSVGSSLTDLLKNAPLYNAQVGEAKTPTLNAGTQGVEAEFGLSATATQQVLQREQARQAQFQGGGGALEDTTGASGIGAAKPI